VRPPAGRRTALAVLAALLLFSLSACSPPSDEAILRDYIDAGVNALNARDGSAALEHVRPGLVVRGEGIAVDARRLMLIYFQRFKKVHVFVYGLDMEIDGRRAELRFNAVLSATNARLPERISLFAVTSRWEKDEDWWLSELRWQRRMMDWPELPQEVQRWLQEDPA